MKRLPTLFIVIAFVVLYGCTDKDINLLYLNPFEITTEQEEIGFVDEKFPIKVVIAPKQRSDYFTYSLTYKFLEGSGTITTEDGVFEQENVIVRNFDEELTFNFEVVSENSGNHVIEWLVSDGRLQEKVSETKFFLERNPDPDPFPDPDPDVNNAPVARNDVSETKTEQSVQIDVLANDADPEKSVIVLVSVSTPENGTAIIQDGNIIYTSNPNFEGIDKFTYTIADPEGLEAIGSVVLEVQKDFDAPPVAQDDVASVLPNTEIIINVLNNDSDPENAALTIVSVATAGNGTATIENGAIKYTSNPNYDGVDTFVYTMADEAGNEATATISVTVSSVVNQPPTVVKDEVAVNSGIEIMIDVLANDSDPEGTVVTLVSVDTAGNGVASIVNGQINYTSKEDFNGVDTFAYTIADADGNEAMGIVSVTVSQIINEQPIATQDDISAQSGVEVTIDVLANDSDPEGTAITLVSVDTAGNGTATIDTGVIKYTSNANYEGVDTFNYTIKDADGVEATGIVKVTVSETINQVPTATTDEVQADAGVEISIDVLANDSDPEGTIVTLISIGAAGNGTAIIDAGVVKYTSNANYEGVDTFNYTIRDADGIEATGIVRVTVSETTNQAPIAMTDQATANAGEEITIDALANDSDPEGTVITLVSVTPSGNGTALIDAGIIKYTSNADYEGVDRFKYTIRDADGVEATGTISITVTRNLPPDAVTDMVEALGDNELEIEPLVNDTDPENEIITLVSTKDPINGSAVIDGDKVRYTADKFFVGTDTVFYTIKDAFGNETEGVIEVKVVEEFLNFTVPAFENVMVLSGNDYDQMVNGRISKNNAERLTNLSLIDYILTDVSDLKLFPNLESLTLRRTQLEQIDLSVLPKLRIANLDSNNLQTLDFSGNPDIQRIGIGDNPNLSTLITTGATNLTQITVPKSGLTNVDLSDNINLTGINIADNKLTSIDLTNNTKLVNIILDGNELMGTVDVRNITDIGRFIIDNNPNLAEILIGNNTQINELNVEQTGLNEIIFPNGSNVKRIQFRNCPSLQRVDLSNNTIEFTRVNGVFCDMLTCVQIPSLIEIEQRQIDDPGDFNIGTAVFSENCNY